MQDHLLIPINPQDEQHRDEPHPNELNQDSINAAACCCWLGLPFLGGIMWYVGFILWLSDDDRAHLSNLDLHLMAAAPLLCASPLIANLYRSFCTSNEQTSCFESTFYLISFFVSFLLWGLSAAFTYQLLELPNESATQTQSAIPLLLAFSPLILCLPQLIPVIHRRSMEWIDEINTQFTANKPTTTEPPSALTLN